MTRDEYFTNQADSIRQGSTFSNAHRKFYGQFAPLVLPYISPLAKKIKASKDPYFNDIPISHWDHLSEPTELQDYYCKIAQTKNMSSSERICIYKEAALQLKEKSQ